VGFATGAYGDSFDPDRERTFTRPRCAELLIDAGAVVLTAVPRGILDSRARGLLQLFHRKRLLPRTLPFFAALGDIDTVRVALIETIDDRVAIDEAFMRACSFEHVAVASFLLQRAIELDSQLGNTVDESGGPLAFIDSLIENRSRYFAAEENPGDVFLKQQVMRALHDRDLATFVGWLDRHPWLAGDSCVAFQGALIGTATLNDRGEFITALFEREPAILRHTPPPASQAIEFALTYGRTHLIPLLTRIWPLPDDLPHAAGTGDLSRVKRWVDASGAVTLGDAQNHYPYNDPRARAHLHWSPPTVQQVVDTAFAFSVINHHFDVADFLLDHGADINTNWNSHEPASILHHLVFQDDYEAMQYLIDRGVDMTIKDYRWNSTAQGWALHGKNDPDMAQWLDVAERRRAQRR
jgi:hypothetical protein